MDESLKRDKEGRFKPRLVFVGIHIPQKLRDELNVMIKADGLTLRAVATALLECYVSGEIKIEKQD